MTNEEIRHKLVDTIEEWGAWEFAYVSSHDEESSEEFQSISKEFIEHSRWSVRYAIVTRHNPTGKLFKWVYDSPATEMQEGQDEFLPQFDDIVEVEPVEETVTRYVPVQN